jgi:hypothetical protein
MHHHLVLDNPYVRVYRASVPANDAIPVHRHDHPYITVSLGDNDFTNAVIGQQDARVKQKDKQINYSEGNFMHAIRTSAGTSFNNKEQPKTIAKRSSTARSG